jgi:predicted O-linked N-acetylglucosamine transferase (SPINDLY family)
MQENIKLMLERAFGFHQLKKFEDAQRLYEQILKVQPNNFSVLMMYGGLMAETGDVEKVIALLKKALKICPNDLSANFNIAVAYESHGHFGKAIECYGTVLKINLDNVNARKSRAGLFATLNRLEDARSDYQYLLNSEPNNFWYKNAQGKVLFGLKDYVSACKMFQDAIKINPKFSEAHFNLGNTFAKLKNHMEAVSSLKSAIDLDPLYGDAFRNLANSYIELGETNLAIENLKNAMKFKTEAGSYTYGAYLLEKRKICLWEDYHQELVEFNNRSIDGEYKLAMPGVALPISDSLKVAKLLADAWVQENAKQELQPETKFHQKPNEKIRIGYYSSDFKNHALASLVVQLFEVHDRENFEIYAFSIVNSHDAMRRRIEDAVDEFIDVSNLSDEEIIVITRDKKIDIAVDLTGYTEGNRWQIFSARIAPIQVNYLGYPGTLGGAHFDYIIADKILIPECNLSGYSEKVVYLPHSYQPNDTKKEVSNRLMTKSEFGLPEEGIVFCCFNNNLKITPEIFRVWMNILEKIEGSVLWLFEGSKLAKSNLTSEAKKMKIDPKRLIFAQRISQPEHIARQRLADIFIDTYPYNAHTTASEALWVGMPVVTLAGETFASRVGASLLTAVGLPELIANDLIEYERLITSLAKNPQKIKEIRDSLNAKRLTYPLFNISGYVKDLESAYKVMNMLYMQKKRPDHIFIN